MADGGGTGCWQDGQASLPPEEKRNFFALVQRLKAKGVAIVFISPAIEEAVQFADRITILRDGELAVTSPALAFDRDKIIQAMVLSVHNLSMDAMLRNTCFTVYAGQVTGVFGLRGLDVTDQASVDAALTGPFLHLAPDAGAFMTGTEIVADGGHLVSSL